MSYTRMTMVRFGALVTLGLALAACGESSTTESAPRNLSYCDNEDAAAPSCSLPGYAVGDDAALRTKLEGCAVGGCHAASGGFTTWGLDLSGSLEDALGAVTIPVGTAGFYLIDDQDPDCSLMLSEVSERPVGAIRMPVTGGYWSVDEVDCFRSYLNEIY